jgi:aspartate racemase
MKTIGLIGGMTWQSTVEYYRIINETAMERQGNGHAARILIDSLDFGDVGELMQKNDLAGLSSLLIRSALRLEQAGAEILLIGANTMHFFTREVREVIHIPLIHIVDATIARIHEKGLKRVVLLGTKFTMEQEFYRQLLREQGIDALVPGEDDMNFIQQTIVTELFYGIKNPASKERFLDIISSLLAQGAEGIILGCTEIPLLLHPEDCTAPVFDTTLIHSQAAVDAAL